MICSHLPQTASVSTRLGCCPSPPVSCPISGFYRLYHVDGVGDKQTGGVTVCVFTFTSGVTQRDWIESASNEASQVKM